jgi:1,4-dihydroxy-2-naphthoate octaprenyltransferase
VSATKGMTVADIDPHLADDPDVDPLAVVEQLLAAAASLRRDLRRRLVATWVAVILFAAAIATMLFVVVHQVQREVHGQICHVIAITYQGPEPPGTTRHQLTIRS